MISTAPEGVWILAVNAGSSTLKVALVRATGGGAPRFVRLATATASYREIAAVIVGQAGDTKVVIAESENGSRRQALSSIWDWMVSSEIMPPSGPAAIGHRIVHGGTRIQSELIDDALICEIEAASQLAPLHNRGALEAIHACRERFGIERPMVAAFDTAFFASLPSRASLYAIPSAMSLELGIRRRGFHGLAHAYLAERASSVLGAHPKDLRLITLQLGNGCSAAAVEGGKPIDTTMGMTPLEGLMMGTRSGDVDPALPSVLARLQGIPTERVVEILNRESGLLGVSGLTSSMADLLQAAADGHTGAELAIDMFCYRVRKQVGAYAAALGGMDAVVFGGGIGENSPEIRRRICFGLEVFGLTIDDEANDRLRGKEGLASDANGRCACVVVPVDESFIIAKETADTLWPA